jgi:hypothetical protein
MAPAHAGLRTPGPAHPYAGERAALLTQHGKERVVGPPLAEALSVEVVVVADFDTDALGTFTRDVPRVGTQLDAARRKALLACAHSGLTLGLGSEGAFGPGPFGLGATDLELVVLVDLELGIEVVGRALGPGQHLHATLGSGEELAAFAERAGFPGHGLVLRPDGEDGPRPHKGLRSRAELEAAFRAAREESATGRVFVESDLRAHQNPTRMALIERAARDLAQRVACLCPACGLPGYGRHGPVPGRPCLECGTPTRLALADEHRCVGCGQRERRPLEGEPLADPSACDHCNP